MGNPFTSTRKPITVEKEVPVFQFIKDTNPSSGQLASKLDTLGKQTKKAIPKPNPKKHHQDLKNMYLPSIAVFGVKDQDKLIAFYYNIYIKNPTQLLNKDSVTQISSRQRTNLMSSNKSYTLHTIRIGRENHHTKELHILV